MKKEFFLLFLVVQFFLTNAQTVSLQWEGVKEFTDGAERQISLPFFSNEGYNVLHDAPYYIYSEETNGFFDISITNVKSAVLNSNERGGLNPIHVPDEFTYNAKVNQSNDRFFITVGMAPLFKENGQIRKITSFEIVKTLKSPTGIQSEGTYDPAVVSVLKNGSWYKIRLKKSGVFKLEKSFFDQNGIPTNFDPRTLKIYGNGGRMLNENPGDFRYGALQQNAIRVVGEEDGSFDSGDYILFYAQGPHDWNRLSNSTITTITHRFNQYSDYAYYFITFGGEEGKRIQDAVVEGSPVQTFHQYDEYQFYEKDSLSVNQVGKQWMGESFTVNPNQSFTLTGGGPTTGEALIKYRLVSRDAWGAGWSLSVNGNSINTNNFGPGSFAVNSGAKLIETSGNTFTFNISVNDINNPGAFVFLDYLEVIYEANLSFNGSQMQFRKLEDLNDGNIYGFSISGPQRVWDISDITTAKNMPNSGGVYKYQSNSPYFKNEFIAFNESAVYTEIEFVAKVENQDIRSLKDVDYAIVTHPDFLSEAVRLANFRTLHDGMKVAVVTTEQVYNDFSSGAQDAIGIRDFFKHLRDTNSPLKYILLFGAASYDYKDRIQNNTNFVPTFISFNSTSLDFSFTTDDYYTMLDDSDIIINNPAIPMEFTYTGASQMDVGVGRFPANNLTEAKIMIDKTLAYYEAMPGQGTSFGDWKTKFLLVVDDDKGNMGPFHKTVENSSGAFINNNIEYATLRKGYLDSFPLEHTSAGPRYPQVNQLISNAFNLGTSLIVYFGHGGVRSWSQTRVITYEEINNFTNFSGLYSRLPIVMTITCEFTVWDLPEVPSAGVFMFKAPLGGAAAMVTTSRPVYVSYGELFNEQIVEQILSVQGEQYQALGPALTAAKVNYPTNAINHISVNLLGDPMLSVARPPRKLRITKINGEDADSFDGVLRALDFVEIEGEVLDESGTMRDNSFNGKANATLFDKPENKSTLNNMRNGDMGVMNYQEQINAIFKGGTNVEYGKFKFQFYVPKDINYEIGEGKLTVYAHNNVIDGVTTKNIKVGGQNPDGLDDDVGPVIGLYMNNLNFVDGGITNKNPYLLACLTDESGINTSGIAIGHDITGVLDNDVEGTYVLNEYYEGGDNNPCTNPDFQDYQKGQVMYRLSNLDLGEHQIVFKAWDINNNSSEGTLDFVVMEEGSDHIYIEKLLNWPNPFINQTYFHFEHNCDSELEVMVQILTVSGKLVKTIRQVVTAEPWREGYRTGRFAIPWDGLDDFGDKIGKGVYIYRLTAKGVNPEICKGSATAIEKLVILK